MSAPQWLDDAEFARRFVRHAVTVQRVEAALAGLPASRLRLGPFSGAAGLAEVGAHASLGRAEVSRRGDGGFSVRVPAQLEFAVRLGVQTTVRGDAELTLTLVPRPAEPLLLVIDVARVRAEDVRLRLRGSGLAAPVTAVLRPVLAEVRGYLAAAVTSALEGSRSRAGRTIDVAARLDRRRPGPPPRSWQWSDEAAFTAALLRHAVTERRVADGFGALVGQPLAIGPQGRGPVTVAATGSVRSAAVLTATRPGVGFDVLISIGLDLAVTAGRTHHYRAELTVPLQLTVRVADPLLIVLEIAPVPPRAVELTLQPRGGLARLVGRLGGLRGRLRRQVAATVNRRAQASPARIIDVGARIDAAAQRDPRRPRPHPAPRAAVSGPE